MLVQPPCGDAHTICSTCSYVHSWMKQLLGARTVGGRFCNVWDITRTIPHACLCAIVASQAMEAIPYQSSHPIWRVTMEHPQPPGDAPNLLFGYLEGQRRKLALMRLTLASGPLHRQTFVHALVGAQHYVRDAQRFVPALSCRPQPGFAQRYAGALFCHLRFGYPAQKELLLAQLQLAPAHQLVHCHRSDRGHD